jgi:lipoprotein NlpI
MRRSRLWALPAALLTLASCAGAELDRAATEACDAQEAWTVAGRPADQREALIARLDNLLAESDTDVLADPLRRFRETVASDELDDPAVADASADFLRACVDRGWKPPEG